MVYGCGNKFVKYMVFLFNFLVFVVGIALLAASLTFLLNNEARDWFQNVLTSAGSPASLNQLVIPLYVLAAVGGLLILTGFLGCCGAWVENTCLLGVFFTIILILFIAELACGIAIFVKKDDVENEINDAITKLIVKYDTLTPKERGPIDQLQIAYNCCGCVDPIKEYPRSTLPDSCKKPGTIGFYDIGCCTKLWNDVERYLPAIAGVAIGLLVIELLAMIFSCILCQAFKRGDYQYA